ncbi:MAG: hypothetical protein KJ720_09895 [Proteobacteria bacterium]|nr:hypothetical protein [Pseudomonadota bacterium]MBU1452400.1 hypothetical protein [Pseudomonadota bacterium]MBU2467667.1 hypothetical protein [Pseudomonadota bacterium]
MHIHAMWPAVCRKNKERPRRWGKLILGPWFTTPDRDQSVDGILERYQGAELHERLNLWMQHRDLRPVLSRLEKTMRDY